MKLFYNENGDVVGSIQEMLPGMESKVSIAGTQEITVSDELVARFNDSQDWLDPHSCKIENGQVRPFTEEERNKEAQTRADQQEARDKIRTQKPRDLLKEIDEIKKAIDRLQEST
jgi:hypothetical protein